MVKQVGNVDGVIDALEKLPNSCGGSGLFYMETRFMRCSELIMDCLFCLRIITSDY